MPGDGYRSQHRSLWLCLCDVFRVLINSLVHWFFTMPLVTLTELPLMLPFCALAHCSRGRPNANNSHCIPISPCNNSNPKGHSQYRTSPTWWRGKRKIHNFANFVKGRKKPKQSWPLLFWCIRSKHPKRFRRMLIFFHRTTQNMPKFSG